MDKIENPMKFCKHGVLWSCCYVSATNKFSKKTFAITCTFIWHFTKLFVIICHKMHSWFCCVIGTCTKEMKISRPLIFHVGLKKRKKVFPTKIFITTEQIFFVKYWKRSEIWSSVWFCFSLSFDNTYQLMVIQILNDTSIDFFKYETMIL